MSMFVLEDYSLRPMNEGDLRQVLAWRNSEHVRAGMYTDHIISWPEHESWYRRVRESDQVELLIFEHRAQSAGLINISEIDTINGKCVWGFYLGETDLPRGSGSAMGFLALEHVFSVRGLRKLSGEVLDSNEASQKFFIRLGFTEEGRLRQHVMKNGRFADVVIYSMLIHEWQDKEKIRVEQMLRPHGSDNESEFKARSKQHKEE